VVLRYEKRTAAVPGAHRRDQELQNRPGREREKAVSALATVRAQAEVNGQPVFHHRAQIGRLRGSAHCRTDAKLAGIVLMAGNARPLEDLLVDQVTYMGITGKQLENAKAIQANVKKLEKGDEDSPSLVGVPASYWLDLKGYDPAAAAKKLGIPMLILQGERITR
jgi:hypothetical protein